MNFIEESNIDLGKLPTSCSGIHQAADVSPLCKAVKARVKSIESNLQQLDNPVLERNISAAISNFESTNSIQVSHEHKLKIKHACLVVVEAVQNMINPSKIRGGFIDTGQFPLNFSKVMNQSNTKLSSEQYSELLECSIHDVELFRRNGLLTELELDASNVPTCDNRVRVQLMIQNQRAVLLTNVYTRSRHLERINSNAPIGNAIVDGENKTKKKKLILAAKLVQRVNDKEAKKAAELARKAAMTPEDKIREAEEKKRKAEARKAIQVAKEQEARELLQEAMI